METRSYKVYKFEELDISTQDKAISNLYDINIHGEWFQSSYEWFKEQLEEIGIECETFYFDIDRGSFIYMDKPSINDLKKFLKYCEMDLRTKESRDYMEYGLTIETQYFGGSRAKNYINPYDTDTDFTDILNDKLNEFLNSLKKEYEYQTSEEAIMETIEANNFMFNDNGELEKEE